MHYFFKLVLYSLLAVPLIASCSDQKKSDGFVYLSALYETKNQRGPRSVSALIPTFENTSIAKTKTKSTQKVSIKLFNSEIHNLPISVSTTPQSIIYLVRDGVRAIKNYFTYKEAIPLYATAKEFAAYFIHTYQLAYPQDNSQAAYYETFTPEIREKIFREYTLYCHKGFVEFIQSFPEYEERMKQCELDRVQIGNLLFAQGIFENKIESIIGQITDLAHAVDDKRIERAEQERIWLQKEEARIALMEIVRSCEEQNFLLRQQAQGYKNIIVQRPDAPKELVERIKAIENFTAGNDNQTFTVTRKIEDPSVIGYLIENDIPVAFFEHFTGNTLQQKLHKEFYDLLVQAAHLPKDNRKKHILDGIVIGEELNRCGYVTQSYTFADVCHRILEKSVLLAKGFCKGSWHSICTMGHAIAHPRETVGKIAQGAYDFITGNHPVSQAVKLFMEMDFERDEIMRLNLTNPALALEKRIKLRIKEKDFNRAVIQNAKALADVMMNDPEKWGYLVGQTTIDLYLTNRIIGFAGKIAKTSKSKIIAFAKKSLKRLEDARNGKNASAAVAGGGSVEAGMSQAAQEAEKAIEASAHLTKRTFDVARYEPTIGNLKKVADNLHNLEKIPGADKLFDIIHKNGIIGSKAGNLGTARGALYELEKAVDLIKRGEEIVKFGFEYLNREFDILTKTKLIECKNINWSTKSTTEISRMQATFGDQIKKAKDLGKIFEVHSKQPIPTELKNWFRKKGIVFFEDSL